MLLKTAAHLWIMVGLLFCCMKFLMGPAFIPFTAIWTRAYVRRFSSGKLSKRVRSFAALGGQLKMVVGRHICIFSWR